METATAPFNASLSIATMAEALEAACPNVAVDARASRDQSTARQVTLFFSVLGKRFAAILNPVGPRAGDGQPEAFIATTWRLDPLTFRNKRLDWRLVDGWIPGVDAAARAGAPHDIAAPIVRATIADTLRMAG